MSAHILIQLGSISGSTRGVPEGEQEHWLTPHLKPHYYRCDRRAEIQGVPRDRLRNVRDDGG